jgi:hypothetical protein
MSSRRGKSRKINKRHKKRKIKEKGKENFKAKAKRVKKAQTQKTPLEINSS